MFRCVPTNEAEKLAKAQSGLRIARNVNGVQRDSLRDIRGRVERLQGFIHTCSEEVVDLRDHLEYLEKQAEREDRLLVDMDSAIRTEENSFAAEVANLVTDCDDTDHMV